jgi:hypothetical protein
VLLIACKSPPSPGYGALEISLNPAPLENQSAVALVYTRNPKTLKRTILERREIDGSGKMGFVLKLGIAYGVQVFWDENHNGLREGSELQASLEELNASAPWQKDSPIEFHLPPPSSPHGL